MGKGIVDGYMFRNAAETERAMKEYENIKRIKKSINIDNPEDVKKMYIKLVEKKYFVTPVGLGFLHEMREYLVSVTGDEELEPIPVPGMVAMKPKNDVLTSSAYTKLKQQYETLEKNKSKLVIAVVALAIVVVGMFFIVVTNENLGYFNAEEKVLNKYSAWQERLQSWENELIEREDALDKTIEKLPEDENINAN